MHLQQTSAGLQPHEKQLLSVKYSQPVISKMTEDSLMLHTQALLLKVHVITGWRIPENDALLTILQDQFYKKLVEDYGDVNPAEIEFAFRKHGTTIQDWGKELNLSFIDLVMNMYLAERRGLSAMEEQLKKQIDKPKPTDEELMSMKRELVELKYQDFLKGHSSFVSMPDTGIATLALDGFCDYDLYQDFLDKALESTIKQRANQIEEYKLSGKTALVKQAQQELQVLVTEDPIVIILAKKMALVYCFCRFQAARYDKIYTDVK